MWLMGQRKKRPFLHKKWKSRGNLEGLNLKRQPSVFKKKRGLERHFKNGKFENPNNENGNVSSIENYKDGL